MLGFAKLPEAGVETCLLMRMKEGLRLLEEQKGEIRRELLALLGPRLGILGGNAYDGEYEVALKSLAIGG